MRGYTQYLKDKKVTVLGLGLLGKRLGDIQFLSKNGAHVLVTDLKNKKELKTSLSKLKGYKNISYRLGEHILSDFENVDFILKGQGTPLDSSYIAHARKRNIPIEMDESLFFKYAPKNIKVIGVTGTRGKTTTTMCIYHVLKKSGVRVHIGGNIRDTALVQLLPKIREGDTVVIELSSWQLQSFRDMHYSPHFAVFTNFSNDHMNYYGDSMKKYFNDKAEIFKYQTKKDFLVVGSSIFKKIKDAKPQSKIIVAEVKNIPTTWRFSLLGEHNKENIACAVEVLRVYGLSIEQIQKGIESFKGVEGRLQYVKNYKGIQIYNDTTATTPQALIKAIQSFPDKNVVLICGGTTKGLPLDLLPKTIKNSVKRLVVLPGSGTDELIKNVSGLDIERVKTLKEAVLKAVSFSKKGDILLFSPGFASFGLFKNEYDRGDQFIKIVKTLK